MTNGQMCGNFERQARQFSTLDAGSLQEDSEVPHHLSPALLSCPTNNDSSDYGSMHIGIFEAVAP